MFERSEFLPARKTSAQRRVPEGQGVGALFSAYSFLARKNEYGVGRGRNPAVLNSALQHL